MKDLAGRTAWITGAASGIGLALARRLAAEQMQLVLVDVEAGPLAEAEAALQGARVLAIRADVGNGAEMAAAAARAQDTFGIVHVICSNAGVSGGGGPMWTIGEADWQWTIDVNLMGVVHAIRLLLPPLVASGQEGHVVNTASIAGLQVTPFMGPYTATKHAVVALSESLAKELELAKANVGVSVVCPGFVKTRIAQSDRNRPGGPHGAPADPITEKFGAMLGQLVESGITAEQVAEQIVAAIREPKFYVLTHKEMMPAVEHRMRQILGEQQPGIDPLFRKAFG
jgi:NAD(P)-dependent dehydrogenase (short-subunit alcohol dehydrogenase family)